MVSLRMEEDVFISPAGIQWVPVIMFVVVNVS
ncbi:Uncharacterised protein [Escherichia coli]|nr:Uncharacterised protein [Escherichia coli]